jgi:hypothetical protein
MMAEIVYRLWRDGHAGPMILLGDVPLVMTRCAREVVGDLSKPAQIDARSPSVGKNEAVTRAATALFMATSPHGSTDKGASCCESSATPDEVLKRTLSLRAELAGTAGECTAAAVRRAERWPASSAREPPWICLRLERSL